MYQQILSYLKNPNAVMDDPLFKEEKLKLFWTSFWMIMVANIMITIPLTLLNEYGIVDQDDHAVMDMVMNMPIYFSIGAAVIIAPLFEELIFRAPITLFKNVDAGWFKVVFYVFAVVFGCIHISNYEMNTTNLLLMPLLCAPQIIAGLFLGMIRVKVGLLYSIIFHALYNGVLIIPTILYYKYVV